MYNHRIIGLFSVITCCLCCLIARLYYLSNGVMLSQAANNQSCYTLNINKSRGTIYDCSLKKLTGNKTQNIAAIIPNIEVVNKVHGILNKKQNQQFLNLFSNGKPFIFNFEDKVILNNKNIDIFKVPIRYSDYQLAPHVIGYLNSENHGIYGIEKAYEEYLTKENSSINVKYRVDAVNNLLQGDEKKLEDNLYKNKSGVVLTLDTDIQEIAQKAARDHLKKGAIIISEVPNCEIRALVSMPDFSPNNLEQAINDKNSPLLNRAFESYNVGSIFKLMTSAIALEEGYDPNCIYDCHGEIGVEDAYFHCCNKTSHNKINLEQAIALSCNTYFIKMTESISAEQMSKMVKKFGFGSSIELAPNMNAEVGSLPDIKSLYNRKTMANFSFGQGVLLSTPIHICAFINTIASNGEYICPKLVEGIVDENLKYVQINKNKEKNTIISKQTANILKNSMKSSIEYGTCHIGMPTYKLAGAKTSTAETGIINNGKSVFQAWFAGFYPFEEPKYSIIILAENAKSGGEDCGPIFKQISDDITKFIENREN